MIPAPKNRKLGPEIHSFSLPAHETCPGETSVCAKACYASSAYFLMKSVATHMRRNYEQARHPAFVRGMLRELEKRHVKTLRIHASGDFYSAGYVRKWIRIISEMPHITFYAYTRSWRRGNILPALKRLAALPNMRLWFSADRETHAMQGRPPFVQNVRVAFMQTRDDEAVPAYTDLVFRTRRRTVLKFAAGRLVCPVEQGTAMKIDLTCAKCKLCAQLREIPKKATTKETGGVPALFTVREV